MIAEYLLTLPRLCYCHHHHHHHHSVMFFHLVGVVLVRNPTQQEQLTET